MVCSHFISSFPSTTIYYLKRKQYLTIHVTRRITYYQDYDVFDYLNISKTIYSFYCNYYIYFSIIILMYRELCKIPWSYLSSINL